MNLKSVIDYIENEVLTKEDVLFIEKNIKEIKKEIGASEIYLFQDGKNYITLYDEGIADTVNEISETKYKLIKTL